MPKNDRPKHDSAADTSAAVDDLMRTLEHPARREIEALRCIILAADPAIREGVKWNAPSWRTTEYFATTHLRAKKGIAVILHFGAKARAVGPVRESIADPEGILNWIAADRASVAFETLDDLTARTRAFQAILRQWIRFV